MQFEIGYTQTQKQTLTPQMLQSLEILRMNLQEMNEFIEAFAMDNPVVEVMPPMPTADAAIPREWRAAPNMEDMLENLSGDTRPSLREELRFQLRAMNVREAERRCVLFYIDSLDEAGYLHLGVEEAARFCACDEATAAKALGILRNMEPKGVGARTLSDCLLLQLQQPEDALARRIAEEYLEDMARNNAQRIAKSTGSSVQLVQDAFSRIRRCNPKPGNGYGDHAPEQYLIPDLFVVEDEAGEWKVILNDTLCPYIQVNPYYQSMTTQGLDAEAAQYIKQQLGRASTVIGHIARRNLTLLQCARCIVELQSAYFQKGPRFVIPMTVNRVAEELQLSPSTVSRAVHGKYIKCIWGCVPIRDLFARAVQQEAEGGSTPAAIQREIAKMVEKESKSNPLSDQKIAEGLQEKGIGISRRTVSQQPPLKRSGGLRETVSPVD